MAKKIVNGGTMTKRLNQLKKGVLERSKEHRTGICLAHCGEHEFEDGTVMEVVILVAVNERFGQIACEADVIK